MELEKAVSSMCEMLTNFIVTQIEENRLMNEQITNLSQLLSSSAHKGPTLHHHRQHWRFFFYFPCDALDKQSTPIATNLEGNQNIV